ncbi:type II toxin-antitoxin system RelE/ParE family toxin [Alkaliphilus pronyensis]|uniref:Type II toxin-antitoxin system RelE/ParE family toxin n=1 Tax=Alkaliphilus pronyensis TaxID=1482732 RepID=A0A6I0FCD8_9FIRM|nr:type II toxin-antitoxin system RelE/ParE family toxin [Alkaliphilus pronyensis]KAB3530931.1 type II toxin-antitoxin system RelE/ParE family toxin [Alkaliphilus pronyensis]
MKKKYRIEYLPIAEKDLLEVLEYIQNDNLSAAISFIDELDSSISKLENFPFIGHNTKDTRLQYLNYRALVVQYYLIFYVVTEDVIEIRRILHGKRKYSFLLNVY